MTPNDLEWPLAKKPPKVWGYVNAEYQSRHVKWHIAPSLPKLHFFSIWKSNALSLIVMYHPMKSRSWCSTLHTLEIAPAPSHLVSVRTSKQLWILVWFFLCGYTQSGTLCFLHCNDVTLFYSLVSVDFTIQIYVTPLWRVFGHLLTYRKIVHVPEFQINCSTKEELIPWVKLEQENPVLINCSISFHYT